MKTKPLVSCLTPCYRMEKYLKLFLDELPKQTIFNKIQVVLDHNEPTDEEIKWVKDFQEKHPGRLKHIIVNPVDPIGVSMNRCIREADGKYVAIWNVDDLRTPSSLELQATILETKNADISHGNFTIVNSFGKKEGKTVIHNIYQNGHKELTRGMVLGPFFMWKKELCNKAGLFDEQLKSGADFDLAVRLALHGKVKTTNKVLGYYLDEGLGASTRGDGRQPTERTVIELRYGIIDKVEDRWLANAVKYDIRKIYFNSKKYNIEDFVPKYENFKTVNGKHLL